MARIVEGDRDLDVSASRAHMRALGPMHAAPVFRPMVDVAVLDRVGLDVGFLQLGELIKGLLEYIELDQLVTQHFGKVRLVSRVPLRRFGAERARPAHGHVIQGTIRRRVVG
eukprot:2580026-Pleurochrysis_carterae.AAC.5